mgnify:CR=1 FL=1
MRGVSGAGVDSQTRSSVIQAHLLQGFRDVIDRVDVSWFQVCTGKREMYQLEKTTDVVIEILISPYWKFESFDWIFRLQNPLFMSLPRKKKLQNKHVIIALLNVNLKVFI